MSDTSLAASPGLSAGRIRWPRPDVSLWLPVVVVVALVVFFSLATNSFATLRNVTALTGQGSALLIACLGTTFVILMGSIDLSVGAIVLLVGAVSVKALNVLGVGDAVVPLALAFGGLLGLANGLVYAYGGIPSFVVTLGSLSIFSGIALQILEGRAIQYTDLSIDRLAIGQIVPFLPNIALCAILAWGLSVVVARHTRFGRYSYLIGGGEIVARTSGIPVRRYKVYAFVASGMLAGLAGVLSVARLGAAGPTLGQDLLLNSLAAIVVGGTSLAGGSGGPQRTLIGVVIITVMDNGLNLMGVSEFTQMIVKGGVVIAAVLVSRKRLRAVAVK